MPQVRSYGQLQATIASKSLLPLDGKVDLCSWDENVVESAKGKEDGKLYAVPLAQQTLQMFYNQGLFDKQGLKPPTTWAQFIAANAKLMGTASRRSPSAPRTTGRCRSCTRCSPRPASAARPSRRRCSAARSPSPTPTGSPRSVVGRPREAYLPDNATGVA